MILLVLSTGQISFLDFVNSKFRMSHAVLRFSMKCCSVNILLMLSRPDPSRAPVYSEPEVQVSVTPSPRPVQVNQYNSSQFGSQYDPYYALYDEDVELYRDVGKSF